MNLFRKKKLLTVLITMSACLALQGCSDSEKSDKPKDPDLSFKNNLHAAPWTGGSGTSIITDNKTGVEYIEVYFNQNKGGGVSITPRLDKNGKPYINPKWRNKR